MYVSQFLKVLQLLVAFVDFSLITFSSPILDDKFSVYLNGHQKHEGLSLLLVRLLKQFL